MNSVSPVLTEAEVPAEQVIALGQEEYFPIIVARIKFSDEQGGGVSSMARFHFSDEERALIASGADLIIGQPHLGSIMPMSLQLAMPGEYPK